jgi:hypothetical protein
VKTLLESGNTDVRGFAVAETGFCCGKIPKISGFWNLKNSTFKYPDRPCKMPPFFPPR